MIRLLLMVVLVFICCTSPILAAPAKGLLYCSESNITSTNPHRYGISTTASSLSYALYDRMLNMNPETKEITSGVAQLTKVSDDGKIYIFKLNKKNIPFHKNQIFMPTRLLNADDIAFTFDRMINPENPFYLAPTEFPFFNHSEISKLLVKVKALDKETVAFYLKEPTDDLLEFLASDNSVILSKQYADAILRNNLPTETIDTQAIGSGPYRLDKYAHERYIKLTPFPPYHGPKPKLPALVIIHSNFSNKRLTQIFTGECHVITNPTPAQIILLEKLNNEKIKILNRQNIIGTFLVLNTKSKPLDSSIKRRTLESLINLEEIKKMVYFGQGALHDEISMRIHGIANKQIDSLKKVPYINNSFITNNQFTNDIKPLTEEEKQAAIKELQKEQSINLYVFKINNLTIKSHIRIAQIIKSNLEEHGIKVNIKTYRTKKGLQRLRKGEFDMALVNVFSDYNNLIEPLVSCSHKEHFTSNDYTHNFTGWCNPQLDKLFNIIRKNPSVTISVIVTSEIFNILEKELPIIPLIYSFNKFVTVSNVKGTEPTPYGGMSFINAYMEDKQ